MSQYTIPVHQFIVNSLQPEIDALNISQTSMEEMGYSNKAMVETERKLNALMPVYDFLKEYTYGDEEVELSVIREMINNTGLARLSNQSNQLVIQSLRSDSDINQRETTDRITVYVNNKIQTKEFIPGGSDSITIEVYGSDKLDLIEVSLLNLDDHSLIEKTGRNSVRIDGISASSPATLVLNVKTYRNNELITEKTMSYKILFNDCDTSSKLFISMATPERFTISDTDINETTNVTIDPNSGTVTTGTQLDWVWIDNNIAPENIYQFDIGTVHELTVASGDTHALLILPQSLTVQSVVETVLGTNVAMTQGVHYDVMSLQGPTQTYNVYYLRNLASANFDQDRTFKFFIIAV